MKKKVKITYLSIKVQQTLIAPTNALRLDLSSSETLREFFVKKNKNKLLLGTKYGFRFVSNSPICGAILLSNAPAMPGGGGWVLH